MADLPASLDADGPIQVTVIVPALDPGPELDLCIASLLEQETEFSFEIIVVDNGSSPPIQARWGRRVRVIVESRRGSYAARNAGLRASDSPTLAFTDADCRPRSSWLRAGLEVLRSGPDAATGPIEIVVDAKPTIAERFERRFGFPQEGYLSDGFAATANLFVKRDTFRRIGDFDASLHSGGDREFGRRLTRSGGRIGWSEEVSVCHPGRRTVRELFAKTRRVAIGVVGVDLRESVPRRATQRRALRRMRPPIRSCARLFVEEDGTAIERLGVSVLLVLVRLLSGYTMLRELRRA